MTVLIEPPGELTDFDNEMRVKWSQFMSDAIDNDIECYDLTQFFNPTKEPMASDKATQEINWIAFPKTVETSSGGSDLLRWQTADSDRFKHQDEYCEWHVTKNSEGKITKVEFTSEGPEYWSFLAEHDPDALLALYHQFVDPAVRLDDLFGLLGNYNPQNKWNNPSKGGKLAHLGHRNNTLLAFVNIAARATILRERGDGTPMTDELELIRCGKYGGEGRHSDPHIGGEVNALARQQADITVANPAGLSMNDLEPVGWVTPDGSDPHDYWHVDRGSHEHQMRTRYEVPEDKDFVVGDILINGRPIEFGGQIADFIRVKLVGLAQEFGQHIHQPVECPSDGSCVRESASSAARKEMSAKFDTALNR